MTPAFEQYRPQLLGLAYRMLGSMWDAEDVVQEAYLRWLGVDQAAVQQPRSYLATVVSRLALDLLRSAAVRRQSYPGQWLPVPVAAQSLEPQQLAEQRDTLSYATLHMMERLTPPERVVLVLREAFEMPYEQIAEVLTTNSAHCRQLYRRAVKHLAQTRARNRPTRAEHEQLLQRFLVAASTGDVAGLTELLSPDVTAWNDGGGKARAAPRPIVGQAHVAGFIRGLLATHDIDWARLIEANGEPAIRLSAQGAEQVVTADIRDGRIYALFAIRNPDKLIRS